MRGETVKKKDTVEFGWNKVFGRSCCVTPIGQNGKGKVTPKYDYMALRGPSD
jgi:hypothetical protein